MNPPPVPPGRAAPPPANPAPTGPPGGYGIGLPPGVDPMIGAGAGPAGAGFGSRQEPMAVVSIVLAIVAVPIWSCCGPASLVATGVGLVLAFVSLGRVNREPQNYSGRQLSIAALIVNALFTLGNLVILAVMVAMFGFGILSGP